MKKIISASSWSGGKDCCLAYYKAIETGYDIRYLLNFVSGEHGRCCFHGVDAGLLKLQAELIGIPIVQKEVDAGMLGYEDVFKKALLEMKSGGIDKMVFGDIYVNDSINWVDRVCKDAGVIPVEPLWARPASEIIEEFIGLGFKAMIISCKADLLSKDFVGKVIDREMVKEFKRRKVCPCGENGEYHTLVVDGPIFKRKIDIIKAGKVLVNGFWEHWFLDIQKYG